MEVFKESLNLKDYIPFGKKKSKFKILIGAVVCVFQPHSTIK